MWNIELPIFPSGFSLRRLVKKVFDTDRPKASLVEVGTGPTDSRKVYILNV